MKAKGRNVEFKKMKEGTMLKALLLAGHETFTAHWKARWANRTASAAACCAHARLCTMVESTTAAFGTSFMIPIWTKNSRASLVLTGCLE